MSHPQPRQPGGPPGAGQTQPSPQQQQQQQQHQGGGGAMRPPQQQHVQHVPNPTPNPHYYPQPYQRMPQQMGGMPQQMMQYAYAPTFRPQGGPGGQPQYYAVPPNMGYPGASQSPQHQQQMGGLYFPPQQVSQVGPTPPNQGGQPQPQPQRAPAAAAGPTPVKRERKPLLIVDPSTKKAVVLETEAAAEGSSKSPVTEKKASVPASAPVLAAAAAPEFIPASAAAPVKPAAAAAPVSVEATPAAKTAAPAAAPAGTIKPPTSAPVTKAAAPPATDQYAVPARQLERSIPEDAAVDLNKNTAERPSADTQASTPTASQPGTRDVSDDEEDDGFVKDVVYPRGQWNPETQSGMRVYSKEFLMLFQDLIINQPKDMRKDLTHLQTRGPQVAPAQQTKRKTGGVGSLDWVPGGGAPRGTRRSSATRTGSGSKGAAGGGRVIQASISREIKPLEQSDNAWKPIKLDAKAPAEDPVEKETLALKTARGVLNKLTLEFFDKLSGQLVSLGTELPTRMPEFIDMVFDKACTEAFFSSMYAKLCKTMSDHRQQSGDLSLPDFRKQLLNKCQEEFEKIDLSSVPTSGNKKKAAAATTKTAEAGEGKKDAAAPTADAPAADATAAADAKPAEGAADAETEMSDEERDYLALKAKIRMLGNIKFIGELFMIDMVSSNIMHHCVKKLLGASEQEEVLECLCKLLETAGGKLDSLSNENEKVKKIAKQQVDAYLKELLAISNRPKLSSRIKFMIEDIMELRLRRWSARRVIAGPKTISEIRTDSKMEQIAKQQAAQQSQSGGSRNSSRDGGGGGRQGGRQFSRDGGGRSGGGGGYGGGGGGGSMQKPDDEWSTVPKRSERVDPTKIGFKIGSSSDDVLSMRPGGGLGLGAGARGWQGSSLDKKNTTAPQRGPPGGGARPKNAFAALETNDLRPAKPAGLLSRTSPVVPKVEIDREKVSKKAQSTIAEYLNVKMIAEVKDCLKEMGEEEARTLFVTEVVNRSLEASPKDVEALCGLMRELLSDGTIVGKEFGTGLLEPLQVLQDVAIDAPMAGTYMAQLIAVGICTTKLKVAFLGGEPIRNRSGDSALKLVLDIFKAVHATEGEAGVVAKFKELGVALSSYLPSDYRDAEGCVSDQLDRRGLSYLNNVGAASAAVLSAEEEENIRSLIVEGKTGEAIAWIDSKLPKAKAQSVEFVSILTQIVLKHVFDKAGKDEQAAESLAKVLAPILQKYTDGSDERKLHVVCNVHHFAAANNNPQKFVINWFNHLYDNDVVPEEVFLTWEKETTVSKDQYQGKSTALVQVTNDFLEGRLRSGEEEADPEE